MFDGPLSHLRVLDAATGVAGSYCAKLFADNGADVVKLESPAVPGLRAETEPDGSPTSLFLWLNANKRSALLPAQSERLHRLAASADVLIEDRGLPEFDQEFVDQLRDSSPSLIVLTVTPFGVDGPFAGRPSNSLTLSALSGVTALNRPEGRPWPEPGKMLEVQAGMAAYVGALAAVYARRTRHAGQWVEVAELDVAQSVLNPNMTRYFLDGWPGGMGTGGAWRCKDGYVYVLASQEKTWEALKQVLGAEDLGSDPRFTTVAGRTANGPALRTELAPATALHTMQQLFDGLSIRGGVCGMILEPAQVLSDPQLAARDYFVPSPDSRYGVSRYPRPAAVSTGVRWRLTNEAPDLGADDAQVLAEWPQ